MHEFTLISTLAAGFGLALVLGYAASRLGAPPLVGYLLAGILSAPRPRASSPTWRSPPSWPRSG